MRTILLFLLMISGIASRVTFAEEKKPDGDPSGTWTWTSDVQGAQINSRLHLDNDEGKVTGNYSNDDVDVDIENGKFDGRKVSFDFEIDYEGTAVMLSFEGTPRKDQIDGTLSIDAGDQSMELDWNAKRSTEKEDVVGAWELTIETPDGQTLTPTLNLELDDGKLAGRHDSQIGGDIDASDVSLTKNELAWTVETEFNGNDIVLNFSGIPRGSKIAGTVEYDFAGQSGKIDFTGKRKAEKKKDE